MQNSSNKFKLWWDAPSISNWHHVTTWSMFVQVTQFKHPGHVCDPRVSHKFRANFKHNNCQQMSVAKTLPRMYLTTMSAGHPPILEMFKSVDWEILRLLHRSDSWSPKWCTVGIVPRFCMLMICLYLWYILIPCSCGWYHVQFKNPSARAYWFGSQLQQAQKTFQRGGDWTHANQH